MSEFYLLIVVILFLLILIFFYNESNMKNFPPGPRGLPLLGYLPFLSHESHVDLHKLGSKYGGLFSLKLGTKRVVVLNDWKTMKEALVHQSEVFSGRPETHLSIMTNKSDIGSSDGPLWKEKRRFTMQHLRNFGFGKMSMETAITEEIQKCFDYLEQQSEGKVQMDELLMASTLNVIWMIVAGKSYKIKDPFIIKFRILIQETMATLSASGVLNFFPWLKNVPGTLRNLTKSHDEIVKYLKSEIDEHKKTFGNGEPRDFIDVYLTEINRQKEMSPNERSESFQISHLVAVLFDLFLAGVDTTQVTLTWGLMYMALWPEIQQKVQSELDSIIGTVRLPSYNDRKLLPYTEATLLEIQRFATVAPLSAPHSPTKTTNLMGYNIPKGIFILQNIWAVHYDKQLWTDPEVFRPERFLNNEGIVNKPEYLIPFSCGARFCIGEPLARMELYLFFTCLLQRFNFNCITGVPPPSLKPRPNSAVLYPQPFQLKVTKRY